jgi:hypothetical protein
MNSLRVTLRRGLPPAGAASTVRILTQTEETE